FRHLHTELCQMLCLLVIVRGHQELFGRDAAAQGARAAQPLVLFDDGYFQAQLRAANRRHITAGAAPDYRHIKLFSRQFSILFSVETCALARFSCTALREKTFSLMGWYCKRN